MTGPEFSQSSIKRGLLHARSLYKEAHRAQIDRGADTRFYTPTFMTEDLDMLTIDYRKSKSYLTESPLQVNLGNSALALFGQPPTLHHRANVTHTTFDTNEERSLSLYHGFRSALQSQPYLLSAEKGNRVDIEQNENSFYKKDGPLPRVVTDRLPLDSEGTAQLFDSLMALTVGNLYREDGLYAPSERSKELSQESSNNIRRIFEAQHMPLTPSSPPQGLRYVFGEERTALSIRYDPKETVYNDGKKEQVGPGALLSTSICTSQGVNAYIRYHVKMNNIVYPADVRAHMILWQPASSDPNQRTLAPRQIDLIDPSALEYLNTMLAIIADHSDYGIPIDIQASTSAEILSQEINELLQQPIPIAAARNLRHFIEAHL